MARGALPDSHPPHLGMPGMHGTVAAVTALQKADLIVSLGARFDDRVTGKLSTLRARTRTIVHADIDPAEISKNRRRRRADRRRRQGGHRRPDRRAPGGARRGHSAATTRPGGAARRRGASTYPLGYTDAGRRDRSRRSTSSSGSAQIVGPDAIYVAGVGQHQMWAAQFIKYEQPDTWLNSGGLGTMGYAVPAAMGAKVGRPDATVWAIDGDGCFQMTNQELATCAINDIPIKVAIINNSQPRHGPAVADAVLRRALLQHRPAHRRGPPDPGLRQAGRRVRLRRPALRAPGGRRRDDREGDGDQRPSRSSSTSSCTADAMVWPMVAGRRQQRRDPVRPRA